jgi:YD repeat-containing protein
LQGAIQTLTDNNLGQLERVTTTNNEAYKRFWYGPDYTASYAAVNNVADEAYSIQVMDGVGRVIGDAANHPGSVGTYRLVNTIYDQLGHAWKVSNPTEVNNSWVPSGDDSAGIYYTQQTYDWQGRPLRTTHPDATYREAEYSGGCAGGAVVTLTDEGTIDAGIAKRRQQKIYSDVLGRTVKTEILNWQGGSVYSASVNTYNVRDQVTQVRQYAGAEGSTTYQDTTMTYDSYGRLKTKHVPEQNAGAATTYDYFADDTVQKVTDARGAHATYAYNGRHQPTSITYFAPTGITPTPNVSFAYDAAGNRTSMNDGYGSVTYSYNQLSRMSSETRNFTGFGNYTISYQYNLAGDLSSITDPFNAAINYTRDSAGRVTGISGTPFGGVTSYTSNTKYRAWDAIKQLNYGDSRTLNASFDSRMQVLAFSVTGKISKTYNYYADGKLRFSSDLLDHRFDRFYNYDHLLRLKEALSGAEARGEPATTNRPYKQTYGYDAFNHITARTTKIWWTSDNTITDSYVNNRHVPQGTQWQYDADGRVLTDSPGLNIYDAAGRNIHLETYGFGSAAFGLDGDGQQVKSEETTWNEDLQSDVTETKYYLRSSVLGGRVLTEFWDGISYTRTFVYASAAVLAWQWRSYGSQFVDWEHKDPSGASVRLGSSGQELDPLGSDAGTHGQTIIPDEGALTSYGTSYRAANPNTTYTVDGMAVSLDTFVRRGGHLLQERFALLEDAARSSVPTLLNYGVLSDDGRSLRHFGLNEQKAIAETLESDGMLIRSWLVDDGWFTTLPALQQTARSQGRRRQKPRSSGKNRARRNTQQTNSKPAGASACERFAEELSGRLYHTMEEAGFHADARKTLAHQMVAHGKANKNFQGFLYVKSYTPINGFKPELVANGQDADVYRHILFTAGNALLGTPGGDTENQAFRAYDWAQAKEGRLESIAELADDDAGMEVGGRMLHAAKAGVHADYWGLKREIMDILCLN